MCRIDAAYAHPLDEKNDPKERFVQSLDEFQVQGKLRILLIKHFSDSWQNVFRGISELEEALDKAKEHDSESEKCMAILLSRKSTLEHCYGCYLTGIQFSKTDLLNFLDDVKNTYFYDSPFDFYKRGMEKISCNYYLFVSWLYGKDFCFSKEFFNDESLNSLAKNERIRILWHYLNAIAHQFESLDDTRLLKELTSIASINIVEGPPTKNSLEIMRGFDFIKAWIKFDSQAGRIPYSWISFAYVYILPWQNIETLIKSENQTNEDCSKLLNNWFNQAEREFQKILYLNADLSDASDSDVEQWASELNTYLELYSFDSSFNELTGEEVDARKKKEFSELCSKLKASHVNIWIKWCINKDLQSVLNSKPQGSICTFSESIDKWINKEYFDSWKAIFLDEIGKLDIEEQVSILSCCLPYSEECYHPYFDWWEEKFRNLVELENFPRFLVPSWTVAAIGKLYREDLFPENEVLPFVDMSIGFLRGELSKEDKTESEIKKYHKQLEKLLTTLDKYSSKKSLRHRLLLQRNSTTPFSDEKLSGISGGLFKGNFFDWYGSLKELCHNRLSSLYNTNVKRELTKDSLQQLQNDVYVNFSHELAEFCLSRLRLRKGEKAKDGQYNSSQVVEQSPIWRQGYLKALTELGFDLNGKVHKTVNFTKKSDPNEDVRSIASECYKAVRRHAKKNPTIQDIKRSIIAAEWWLLMCQRTELGFTVNHKEALKTRRTLMRNP